MSSIDNSQFSYSIKEFPFRYMLIENFLDIEYLKKINNYFDKVPDTLYVKESVPQSVMQKLDINQLKENDLIKVKCISEFSEKNKNMDNAKLKEIKIETQPNGQQGINRLFVDKNNIDLFPELVPLKNKLCSKEFTKFLEKAFDKDLSETRLKIELLRNKKDHFLLPHCDCVEKVVSFLIYINFNDQPLDSGTDVYTKKDNIIEDSTMKRTFENFNTISTTPFINNSCFIFCATNNSWHGVNPGKTFTDRRLVQLNWVSKEFSSHPDCFPVNQ